MPEGEQVRGRLAAPALVVDDDGVAGNVGELAIDLDDVDAARGEEPGRLPADRCEDHAGRTQREERARADDLLLAVAVVGHEHRLVARGPQRLLDPRRQQRVELVCHVRDDDADDAARALLERPRRRVRDVAEPLGRLDEPGACARARRSRGR